MEIEAGRILSERYRLIRPVGQGSQAAVWIAEHLALNTLVAVKLIDPELAKKDEARERFRREATAAAQLRSAHVVQIIDHGIDGDQPFIVMELLEGEDLFERLDKRQKLSLRETSKILTQVTRALARAHAAGIVHRDLKPENVFLAANEDDEIVKVLDFGVAKISDPAKHTMQRTGVGTLIGTPHYMSPEQVKGISEVDFRTDIWALGVIAFQCVTGQLPFDSEGVGDLLIRITVGEIPVPSNVLASIPASFDAWFARACDREPARRFESARAAADALAKLVAVLPESARGELAPRPPRRALPPLPSRPSPAVQHPPRSIEEGEMRHAISSRPPAAPVAPPAAAAAPPAAAAAPPAVAVAPPAAAAAPPAAAAAPPAAAAAPPVAAAAAAYRPPAETTEPSHVQEDLDDAFGIPGVTRPEPRPEMESVEVALTPGPAVIAEPLPLPPRRSSAPPPMEDARMSPLPASAPPAIEPARVSAPPYADPVPPSFRPSAPVPPPSQPHVGRVIPGTVSAFESSGRITPLPEFDPARRRRKIRLVAFAFVLLGVGIVFTVIRSQMLPPPPTVASENTLEDVDDADAAAASASASASAAASAAPPAKTTTKTTTKTTAPPKQTAVPRPKSTAPPTRPTSRFLNPAPTPTKKAPAPTKKSSDDDFTIVIPNAD